MRAPRTPAHRLLVWGLACWLAAWLVQSRALLGYFVVGIGKIPVRQPFFAGLFGDPTTATIAYVAPVGLVGVLLRPTVPALRLGALLATLAAAVMLLHADGYNDATYLVGLWTGLWLCWLAGQARRPERAAVVEAGAFILAIGAFLFLGGVVGKLHREWWNGDVMLHVLVEGRTYWFYPWLRTHVAPETLGPVMAWIARGGLVVEMLAVLAPLLPLRAGLAVLAVASCGIVATAGWMLLSVVGVPAGAALVCLWLLRPAAAAGVPPDAALRN